MSLPGWLADPDLRRVWAVLRDRVEARGLRPAGRVVLADLSRAERHAVSALLGRPVTTARVSVDLAELDARLAARSGTDGLLAVLTAVTGDRLRDRPAAREQRAAQREAPFVAARAAIAADPVLAGLEWVAGWLDGVRRSGLLARVGTPADVLVIAVAVMSRLLRVPGSGGSGGDLSGGGGPRGGPGGGGSSPSGSGPGGGGTSRGVVNGVGGGPCTGDGLGGGVSRGDLAATCAGGAHALDDGTTLAQVVLRGLAAAAGEQAPTSTAARRELWERFGVATDAVSSTCLTLGLRPHDPRGATVARRLRLAADAGDPVHLTPWDLRQGPLRFGSRPFVLVCENPRVLEAVAQRHGGAVAVVCTAGQPSMVVLDVLSRLAASGMPLRYHGDFDWPGIAIANRLVERLGVRPWLMAAPDYERSAVGGSPSARLALAGRPVEPVWDPELGAAMRHRGIAVHEEAVLDDLLTALDPAMQSDNDRNQPG